MAARTLALSIRQPHAEAIMRGKKKIECRSRSTNARGRVRVYAALGRYSAADEERMMAIRVLGHLELHGALSQYVKKADGQSLVESGMYAKVRHPMYLGSLLLFVGIPLVLGATWAWGFSALGVVGIAVRIRGEEAFLAQELPGYREYMQRTWRRLPHVC